MATVGNRSGLPGPMRRPLTNHRKMAILAERGELLPPPMAGIGLQVDSAFLSQNTSPHLTPHLFAPVHAHGKLHAVPWTGRSPIQKRMFGVDRKAGSHLPKPWCQVPLAKTTCQERALGKWAFAPITLKAYMSSHTIGILSITLFPPVTTYNYNIIS